MVTDRVMRPTAVNLMPGLRDGDGARLAKVLNNEEELANRSGPVLARAPDAAADVSVTAIQTAPETAHGVADQTLEKASTAARPGAAATQALGPGVYGLTFPERVDVKISAVLNKATGRWSPRVLTLTGRFSMQTRLLPGQSEITGPGGNTTSANFCDQATNLSSIGNTLGNTWYVIEAVRRHEAVHAQRFAPALKDAEPTITADIQAVSIPDAPGMKKAAAVAALTADPAFQAEVTKAQQTWLASILVRVAGDHAAGGPTDKAEQKVTEPLRKTICKHAKKKKWPACPACP
jgi:hypothetical protein